MKHPFCPSVTTPEPSGFDSPFCNSPSPYAQQAVCAVQKQMESMDWGGHDFFAPDAGQIFGVLVVRDEAENLAVLHGFSGKVAGQWLWPGFVPPLFDVQHREAFLPEAERSLQQLGAHIEQREADTDYLQAQQLLDTEKQRLLEQTQTLQATLVARKAARRLAREGADAELLGRLLQEGEADSRLRAKDKQQARQRLSELSAVVASFDQPLATLVAEREALAQETREAVQAGYSVPNGRGERAGVGQLFEGRVPPEGSGDCAGPKLLSYAYRHGLTPVAMAEFWWGAAPADEVRHHRYAYPSCRSRCRPLLSFMLEGLPVGVQPAHLQPFEDPSAPEVVYEDSHLILVHKPAGLLSVPGLAIMDSVQSRLQGLHRDKPELQLVHRLDQSTSGLLLLAKTRRDHKALQRQFTGRTIRKEYIALLDGEVQGEEGEVSLPLRVDLMDRPRQLVCYQHGKPALTRWKVLSREGGLTRVALFPVTGRTHQLRVHMAHVHGLGLPMVGDELYGREGERLHLHAHSLCFIHPGTGESVSFSVPVPF